MGENKLKMQDIFLPGDCIKARDKNSYGIGSYFGGGVHPFLNSLKLKGPVGPNQLELNNNEASGYSAMRLIGVDTRYKAQFLEAFYGDAKRKYGKITSVGHNRAFPGIKELRVFSAREYCLEYCEEYLIIKSISEDMELENCTDFITEAKTQKIVQRHHNLSRGKTAAAIIAELGEEYKEYNNLVDKLLTERVPGEGLHPVLKLIDWKDNNVALRNQNIGAELIDAAMKQAEKEIEKEGLFLAIYGVISESRHDKFVSATEKRLLREQAILQNEDVLMEIVVNSVRTHQASVSATAAAASAAATDGGDDSLKLNQVAEKVVDKIPEWFPGFRVLVAPSRDLGSFSPQPNMGVEQRVRTDAKTFLQQLQYSPPNRAEFLDDCVLLVQQKMKERFKRSWVIDAIMFQGFLDAIEFVIKKTTLYIEAEKDSNLLIIGMKKIDLDAFQKTYKMSHTDFRRFRSFLEMGICTSTAVRRSFSSLRDNGCWNAIAQLHKAKMLTVNAFLGEGSYTQEFIPPDDIEDYIFNQDGSIPPSNPFLKLMTKEEYEFVSTALEELFYEKCDDDFYRKILLGELYKPIQENCIRGAKQLVRTFCRTPYMHGEYMKDDPQRTVVVINCMNVTPREVLYEIRGYQLQDLMKPYLRIYALDYSFDDSKIVSDHSKFNGSDRGFFCWLQYLDMLASYVNGKLLSTNGIKKPSAVKIILINKPGSRMAELQGMLSIYCNIDMENILVYDYSDVNMCASAIDAVSAYEAEFQTTCTMYQQPTLAIANFFSRTCGILCGSNLFVDPEKEQLLESVFPDYIHCNQLDFTRGVMNEFCKLMLNFCVEDYLILDSALDDCPYQDGVCFLLGCLPGMNTLHSRSLYQVILRPAANNVLSCYGMLVPGFLMNGPVNLEMMTQVVQSNGKYGLQILLQLPEPVAELALTLVSATTAESTLDEKLLSPGTIYQIVQAIHQNTTGQVTLNKPHHVFRYLPPTNVLKQNETALVALITGMWTAEHKAYYQAHPMYKLTFLDNKCFNNAPQVLIRKKHQIDWTLFQSMMKDSCFGGRANALNERMCEYSFRGKDERKVMFKVPDLLELMSLTELYIDHLMGKRPTVGLPSNNLTQTQSSGDSSGKKGNPIKKSHSSSQGKRLFFIEENGLKKEKIRYSTRAKDISSHPSLIRDAYGSSSVIIRSSFGYYAIDGGLSPKFVHEVGKRVRKEHMKVANTTRRTSKDGQDNDPELLALPAVGPLAVLAHPKTKFLAKLVNEIPGTSPQCSSTDALGQILN